MLIGAGAAGEDRRRSNELKAALARGEFPAWGDHSRRVRKHIQGDPALERRFVPVLVRSRRPPTRRGILRGAAAASTSPPSSVLPPRGPGGRPRTSPRGTSGRYLPDKAFAAIDLAGSRARREGRASLARRRGHEGRENGRLAEERLLSRMASAS